MSSAKGNVKWKDFPGDVAEKQPFISDCNGQVRQNIVTEKKKSYKWTLGTVTAAACLLAFCLLVYIMYLFQPTPVIIENNVVFAPGIVLVQKETRLISSEEARKQNIPTDKIKATYSGPQCDIPSTADRVDCFPDPNASQENCEKRGCCWNPPSSVSANPTPFPGGNQSVGINVPYCYFPTNYPTYKLDGELIETDYGFTAKLTKTEKSPWPGDIMELRLDGYLETATRFHFKLSDPNNKRYEVPIDVPKVTRKASDTQYEVHIVDNHPFGIRVMRKSSGAKLFDTTDLAAPLIYADQFLQISSKLASSYVYGLGEHRANLLQNVNWTQRSFWTRDQPPMPGMNLYGVHPFFLGMEDDGKAHGVFFLNSNAMDVALQPAPAVTFRSIGGVLDFYIFTGDTPDAVVEEYISVIGKPFFPPYWSLGFHLCRYGYMTSANLSAVIQRMRAAQFPYDVQWTDIDYMHSDLDFTYDHDRFKGLPDIVNDLHQHGQKYVLMVDPAISSQQPRGQYPPFDEGAGLGVFVKNASGSILEGKVWPGNTAFPDFTNPKTADYWYQNGQNLYKQLQFDGWWNDMNEPSNFVSGSITGCTNNNLDKPPYVPGITGGTLADRTLCPSAQQHISSHYNLHNMYGHFETKNSISALLRQLGKRSMVITRSSYPGTGQYAGHWLGDNSATWNDLYFSIPGFLNFQLFGIPLVGADVCGFLGDTTEELCTRWMQLGAFYPFMRNHNSLGQKAQDPAVFSQAAQEAMRTALKVRYNFLPYLYTLFFRAHYNGSTVARPLFFQYPTDKETWGIDNQFMWGDAFLISPVVTQGARTVRAYIPKDTWYDIYAHTPVTQTGQYVILDAPLDKINVFARGGTIVPMQEPEVTTAQARRNPFSLLVNPSADGMAKGELYWDDGDQIDPVEKGVFNLITFTMSEKTVHTNPDYSGFNSTMGMPLNMVVVRGVADQVTSVKVNGQSVTTFTYTADKQLLSIKMNENLMRKNTITWM